MTTNPHQSKEFKLVIAGLDNAGKTSALIALRQKYNFYERVKNLKPTIKIDYSSFKFINTYRINLWDMGGQKKFRKIYLTNPVYFYETDYIYYLIDVQDELKFEESVEYLHELLDIYRDLNYTNEVIICFNKFDPKFKNDEDYLDRAKMVTNLILSQNNDIKFKFFNTSYYDISSISQAFSYSLNTMLHLKEIDAVLNRFVNNYSCNYAILYTDTGLIISDHYMDVMDSREFEEKISNKLNDDLEFFQRIKDEKVDISDRTVFSNAKTFYVRKFLVEIETVENVFYVGISALRNNFSAIKNELNDFQSILLRNLV